MHSQSELTACYHSINLFMQGCLQMQYNPKWHPAPHALLRLRHQSRCLQAFSNMMIDEQRQAILISGESGAGKTESAKMVMQVRKCRHFLQTFWEGFADACIGSQICKCLVNTCHSSCWTSRLSLIGALSPPT